MVTVEEAFFVVSMVIFVGYFGLIFFKKTKISEILVLLTIGLILGPGIGFIGPNELALFQGFLPFFASFALIVILFEGGMQLNFFKTLRSLPSAFIFAIIVFSITLVLISLSWFFFTQNLLQGLLLGAVLGGTSSAIIIPLVNSTSAKEETKTLLGLESALTDALCVVTAVTIAQIMILISTGNGEGVTLSGIGTSILGAFSIATVLGGILGFIWLKLLVFFEKKPYEYLVTLAVLLFLFTITQIFGGNGAIAALIFGIVLGNSEDLTNMLRFTPRKLESTIKSFQMEVSFIVRTFFFVYLGVLFKPIFLSNSFVILSAGIILFIIIFSRFIGAIIIGKLNSVFVEDNLFLTMLSSRGLAAASLISAPLIVNLPLGEVFNQMAAIVFLVIFGSNILATIGTFISEKNKKNSASQSSSSSAQ